MASRVSAFNKEKLCCILAAVFCAVAVVHCCSTAPLRITPGQAITFEQPVAEVEPDAASTPYRRVAAASRNPFVQNEIPPPPPSQTHDSNATAIGSEKDQRTNLTSTANRYDFVGVVNANETVVALLRSNNGEICRVRIGDAVGECTVAKIEHQTIWLKDRQNHMHAVKDKTFTNSVNEVAAGNAKS